MAPGSFECLLQTRGSNHIKQQIEEEIKPRIVSSCCSLSGTLSQFQVFSVLHV